MKVLKRALFIRPSTGVTVPVRRQSEHTVLVQRKELPDSDGIIIEDPVSGHRYRRDIGREQFGNGEYVYTMI